MDISLSKYYPPGTFYFHSFPAGEDSNFFNPVPAWTDELAAGRPLVCAGDNIKIIVFAAATTPKVLHFLREELHLPIAKKENILTLPEIITSDIEGHQRNVLIKKALKELSSDGQLIMSQPYLDDGLKTRYQIPPELVIWLNDKQNIFDFIPSEFLPKRYQTFTNGFGFFESNEVFPIPCVVKVSLSGAGDGVQVCHNPLDIEIAKEKFKKIAGPILVEECVEVKENLCVQFGVSSDSNEPIEIIGINEQLTTKEGGFLGGMIYPQKKDKIRESIFDVMLKRILPKVRDMGWYGVGGIDVLISNEGQFYFIDCNFRMNASLPYLTQVRNGQIKKPMLNFTGKFIGSEDEFVKKVVPLAYHGDSKQILNIINFAQKKDCYHFNASMLFDDNKSMVGNSNQLLKAGIDAIALKKVAGLS